MTIGSSTQAEAHAEAREYSFAVMDNGRVIVTVGPLTLPECDDFVLAHAADDGLRIWCSAFSLLLAGFPVEHLGEAHSLHLISCDAGGEVLAAWDCVIS